MSKKLGGSQRHGRLCPTCGDGLRPAAMFVLNGRRFPLYPKDIPAQAADGHWFNFHEHRYHCGSCRVEWIYSTQDRCFVQVDLTKAQLVFDPTTGLLVERDQGVSVVTQSDDVKAKGLSRK